MHAPQYTLRGLPLEVDKVLRDRAKQRHMSINQVIIEELTKATVGEKRYADFSAFVGCMEPDAAFDEALEMQRQVNPEDWR